MGCSKIYHLMGVAAQPLTAYEEDGQMSPVVACDLA